MNLDSGTYQLILEIKNRTKIRIGALGIFEFEPGTYIYTGRAKQGLRNRILRHFQKDKPQRWHIDYLTNHPDVRILKTEIISPNPEVECIENQRMLSRRDTKIVVEGFGSSDCSAGCPAHLVLVGSEESI